MRILWLLCISLFFISSLLPAIAQQTYKQPATLGIHFLFNDFATASAIRNSSLSTVIRDKTYSKLRDMPQGLAVSYGQGLTNHYDVYTTLAGSFLAYPFENEAVPGSDYLLLEADMSIRAKMLPDHYWFVPYLQAGAGVSKYKGYWGTFIPVGIGFQLNFFDEAYLHFNSQYRIAVTESTSYHFIHSIGLVGNIGKRD